MISTKFLLPSLIVCLIICASIAHYFVGERIQSQATISILSRQPEISTNRKEEKQIHYSDDYQSLKLDAQLRRRGGMSIKYDKHSYSIELANDFPLAGLPSDDDWILNSSYIDKTFIRNAFCYWLYQRMDPKNNTAAQTAFVRVKFNEKPLGLYVLSQELNAGTLGLKKQDPMAMVFKDPPVFREKRLPKKYLQDTLNYYQQKYPPIQVADRSEHLIELANFLQNANDTLFAQRISNFFSIDQLLHWHLLLLFTNNSDGILKNFYLYKTDSNSPFKIAIWDYDHSLGRDGDYEKNLMSKELDCKRSVLFKRLLNNPILKWEAQLKAEYAIMRNQHLFHPASNFQKIEIFKKALKSALPQNEAVWPNDGPYYLDGNNFDEEIELIKEYIQLRTEQLDVRFDYKQ